MSKKIKLELKQETLNAVLDIITSVNLPYKQTAPIIEEINTQYWQQLHDAGEQAQSAKKQENGVKTLNKK